MDTLVVLKFGGSSVSDNDKLLIVAEKIREFYDKDIKVVVVVSAQGKMTDKLLGEAKSITKIPNERELDVLLSSGEQMSISKLAICLNNLKIPAISLTGWQAGIFTNKVNQNAIILDIDISRIQNELNQNKVVIVAGFQGINELEDITTLGRGGSDTTAVALAAKLNADKCYIYSEVDGIYMADPNKIKDAKKLNNISYDEMIDMANEGAKVLQARCVEIGKKYSVPIVAKSTFLDNEGTNINSNLEEISIKSIVKNDKLKLVKLIDRKNTDKIFNCLYKDFVDNSINVKDMINTSKDNFEVSFTIIEEDIDKLENLLSRKYFNIKSSYRDISKVSIIGSGILKDNNILKKTILFVEKNMLEILKIETSEFKISILFKDKILDETLDKLYKFLLK